MTEKYLDSAQGTCILANPVAARIVQDAILFGHGSRYQLHAWAVMPNHVHVVLTLSEGEELCKTVQSIKSFSAREIHRVLGGEGRLWQPDYFDRILRDERHFEKAVQYVEWNPVKAKLATDMWQYAWSSAFPSNERRLCTG